LTSQPCDERPDEQTAAYDPAATEAISQVSGDWTEDCINPFEYSWNFPPVCFTSNVGEIEHDRSFHRREQLPVEIIQ
jgi:hypothetical protein